MVRFFNKRCAPEDPEVWWNKPAPWSVFIALVLACLACIMFGAMVYMVFAGELTFAVLSLLGASSAAYLAWAVLCK